jgi:hypothetical protein
MDNDLYFYFWLQIIARIWLNIPWDDRHFFYIYLCMIATMATSKHSLKKALLLWHSKSLNNVFKCPTEKFINLRTFIHLIIHSFIHSVTAGVWRTHSRPRPFRMSTPGRPLPSFLPSFLPSSSSSHFFCGVPARISPFCPQNHHRCDAHRCFAVIERVHALFGVGWAIWRGRLQYCDGAEKGNHALPAIIKSALLLSHHFRR